MGGKGWWRAHSGIQDKPTASEKCTSENTALSHSTESPGWRDHQISASVSSLPLPSVVRGAARCSHELELYTSSHCACSPITGLMNTSLSPYHQSPGLNPVNAEGRAEMGITERNLEEDKRGFQLFP